MNDDARTTIGTPIPTPAPNGSAELREQIERTRDELGQTVEALAAKADVKAQAKEKTAAIKDQAAEKAEQAAAVARGNRTPLLVLGAAVAVFLVVRRSRGHRR
ncbi:DUF3618 domain-containing protein [Streptomyces sp. TBY4]|uniref:DUF3618 domain-containing protein n=1 Tax=Streptomyces sp. TBY4 TaxID=2962030 RepID=UPI0020B87AB5|nr:DUF3618 domain-containing protein [Streptomyces sp. TBY4]MCP3754577.1 DUF3618 domain-containing protein [Streptomyces sp. TBY4]